MTNNDTLIDLHPIWRQAIQDFIDAKFSPGDTVTHDWLYEHFRIDRPRPATPLEIAQKAELQFLSSFKAFEECLLEDYQIALASVRGVGYKLVPPKEQTAWAEKDGYGEIRRAYRRLGSRLSNVDMAQLTVDERKQNADAMARFAMLKTMVKQVSAGTEWH